MGKKELSKISTCNRISCHNKGVGGEEMTRTLFALGVLLIISLVVLFISSYKLGEMIEQRKTQVEILKIENQKLKEQLTTK